MITSAADYKVKRFGFRLGRWEIARVGWSTKPAFSGRFGGAGGSGRYRMLGHWQLRRHDR